MIGADTSFLIDFLKGDEAAILWMEQHKDNLCICENIIYEFLCGNLKNKQSDIFLGFISQFPVLSFDRKAALKSSMLFRNAKRKGRTVAHPDVMIAGVYLSNSISRIITRNSKHFAELPIETLTY